MSEVADPADRAGISPRTVRYYIHQGLLPSPGKGANARYDVTLVDRLRFIREHQEQHLPLSEIRKRLEDLDEEGIGAALGKPLEGRRLVRLAHNAEDASHQLVAGD